MKIKLPTVRDYMAPRVLTLSPDMPIMKAVDFFLEHRISGAPVLDGEALVGILSEKDCLNLLAKGYGHERPGGNVSDYMKREVATVPPSMDIYYAAGLFLKNVFRRFPVVDDGVLIGQISRRDVFVGHSAESALNRD